MSHLQGQRMSSKSNWTEVESKHRAMPSHSLVPASDLILINQWQLHLATWGQHSCPAGKMEGPPSHSWLPIPHVMMGFQGQPRQLHLARVPPLMTQRRPHLAGRNSYVLRWWLRPVLFWSVVRVRNVRYICRAGTSQCSERSCYPGPVSIVKHMV